MRLFIAVPPSCAQRERLLAAQQLLRSAADGRFTRPDDLHITLAFLGECEPEPIINILQSLPRFRAALQLQGAGNFGNLIWAGIKKESGLAALQTELTNRLRDAGYQLEVREFLPHITLCRKYTAEPDLNALSALLVSNAEPIDTIHLMQTTPEGYSSLFSQSL